MERKLMKLGFGLLIMIGSSCQWEQVSPEVDCDVAPVVLALSASTDTGCGSANGSFEVSVTGGEAPYEISSEAGTSNDGVYESLQAGVYNVLATDINGCSSELTVNIQNLEGVNLEDINLTQAGCGSADGSINVTGTGGQEPYLYRINDGAAQDHGLFSDLGLGSYTVTIEDQLGCEVSETVDILSGVSYAASVKGIIENNCAVSGCHNGSISPNLTSFDNIQARADRIKARTGNKTMPQGSSLTQAEIDLIACWVDDGAQDN